jgi:hypothetical protein
VNIRDLKIRVNENSEVLISLSSRMSALRSSGSSANTVNTTFMSISDLSNFWTLPDFEIALEKADEIKNRFGDFQQVFLESMDGLPKKLMLDFTSANITRLLDSCCVLGQYECGSGFCVDPIGLVMTCGHCVIDDDEQSDDESDDGPSLKEVEVIACAAIGKFKTLVFASGQLAVAKCVHVDVKRDAALLKIVYVHSDELESMRHYLNKSELSKQRGRVGGFKSKSSAKSVTVKMPTSFPFLPLARTSAKPQTHILCIGQPGRDDLESSKARKTNYPLISFSNGRIVKYAADLHNNFEIGALAHNAWTYWGHSGAPLIAWNSQLPTSVAAAIAAVASSSSDEQEPVSKKRRLKKLSEIDSNESSSSSPSASSSASEAAAAIATSDDAFPFHVVGMHSSWDDETALRHGVPAEALRTLLS